MLSHTLPDRLESYSSVFEKHSVVLGKESRGFQVHGHSTRCALARGVLGLKTASMALQVSAFQLSIAWNCF